MSDNNTQPDLASVLDAAGHHDAAKLVRALGPQTEHADERTEYAQQRPPGVRPPGSALGIVSVDEEAHAIGEALKQFSQQRASRQLGG